MSKYLLALLLIPCSARAGVRPFQVISGADATFTGITATSVTVSNLPANSVVFTGTGGLLSVVSTFSYNAVGGNLGIGTASPQSTLEVNGGASFGSGITKSSFSTIGSLTLDVAATLTAQTASIPTITSSITMTSNAGSTGASMLDLTPANGANMAVTHYGRTNGNFYVGTDNTAGTGIGCGVYGNCLWGVSNRETTFGTNNTRRMTILAGGNVGIGAVTAPTTLLHVTSGTVTIDGNVTPAINVLNGEVGLWARTKAQIDTLTPNRTGMTIFCSNCATNGDVCVSTGTAAAQWRRVGTSAGCGSSE